MSQWTYVTAAYLVAIGATLALLAHTMLAMRRAERAVDDLRRR